MITTSDSTTVLLESVLAAVIAIGLVLLHRSRNRVLFAPSKQLYLYALPAVLALALPWHYNLSLPVALYIFWMIISVFWQDYLTFGLLQSYLGEGLRARVVIPLVAVLFYLGHAVLLPERFAPSSVLPALGILALGLVLASLRNKLKTMHLILALHLSFYFFFA